MKKVFILLLVMLLPLIVGAWVGYSFGFQKGEQSLSGEMQNGDGQPEAIQALYQTGNRDSINQEIYSQRQNAITRSVAHASSAVVGINVTEVREYRYNNPWSQFFGDDPFFRQYFGPKTYKQEIKGLGSGFIISPDGYIITNDHVAGNASKITVTLTSKEKYDAEIIGTDPSTDVCLLKIDGHDLPYLRLGNSNDVIIAEWVIALGNPFGLFEISDKPTVTVGVVSATGMNINAGEGRYYRDMIQTDASINSGNSGGPLINSVGEAIGVNSVIFTPNQGSVGVGFAIPINRVKKIVDELRSHGKVERNFWTGLDIQSVDGRVARYFGLDKAEGVIISDVKRNSPAAKSGFKVGDIIVDINGEPIKNEEAVNSILSEARVGDVWKVKIMREKELQTLQLKLERSQR
ncbi:MAG: trypsin-like peptidase domain-containing protein [Ignavibacteriae bacterium]|nr:trypsin-like peptidase domain-containing protein [Ignavibacteriota bacterium]